MARLDAGHFSISPDDHEGREMVTTVRSDHAGEELNVTFKATISMDMSAFEKLAKKQFKGVYWLSVKSLLNIKADFITATKASTDAPAPSRPEALNGLDHRVQRFQECAPVHCGCETANALKAREPFAQTLWCDWILSLNLWAVCARSRAGVISHG